MAKTLTRLANFIGIAAAFLAVCGFQLLYQIRAEGSTMFSNSVLCMVLLVSFAGLGIRFLKTERPVRLLIFGLAGGFLYATLTCFGFSLNYTSTIWNSRTFAAILCLTPFFGLGTGVLLAALSGERQGRRCADNGSDLKDKAGGRYFALCWLLLFLSWVPVWLASWPGIFSYDYGNQLVTYVDGAITAHHPILHTWLLGVCRDLGLALGGTNNTGAAIYTCFQMLLMSGLYARVCCFLKRRMAPRWLQVGSFLFLAFHPVNSLMALCATKDSIFTALFATFLVRLFEIEENPARFFGELAAEEGEVPQKSRTAAATRREVLCHQAMFVLHVFLLFAFRNNAFHTFLLCTPFLLIVYRRYWKRMLLLLLVCFVLRGLYTGPIYQALGVEPGDPREMCSVLMQSAARVWNLDRTGLTEEEQEAFLSIISEEGLDAYLPRFADTVKAEFNGKKFAENPWPFLKAWISAGLRHKKIYLDAFLVNTFGYWYPGNSIEETDDGKDYFEYACKSFREDIDVTMESKLPGLSEFYRQIGNEASFQNVPGIAASFNLGSYTWLLLFAALFLLYRRNGRRLILLAPLFFYFVTNLLGPVVKMRYHYPLIACAPLVLYLIWSSGRNGQTYENQL